MKDINFEQFKEKLLYHRIVKWTENTIVLDNGITISIEETDKDCCASASGEFTNVEIEAVITSVSEPKYSAWEDGDTFGCSAVVKFKCRIYNFYCVFLCVNECRSAISQHIIV